MPLISFGSTLLLLHCHLFFLMNHCAIHLVLMNPDSYLSSHYLTKVDKKMGDITIIDRDALTESQKWSYITDNTLKMMSLGFLCGGAISMVVFRSVASRAAVTAFGTGFGIGKSYVDTKYVLGHDVAAETVWSAQVALPKSST
ncbi:hypothetical protein, conserved [Leishmania tarentolae]|uniref:MICOS complex subunit MIC10 n=1 Tax=Leishmania tarentolae TaxID=5689 RepID=A0A640KF14_LEITA|nr:hypothetical protein, conserved [Leishmania tarentolae]